MAFDDVKINTPLAIVIWLNSLAAFLIGLGHGLIRLIEVYQGPHDYLVGYLGRQANGLDIFLYATLPLWLYLPGLYAYHTRGYLSRIYAGLLGIVILVGNLMVPALQGEITKVAPNHYQHLFLYIALSQLLYAFFGKCQDKM